MLCKGHLADHVELKNTKQNKTGKIKMAELDWGI